MKPTRRAILKEVLSSLPRAYSHTTQLPPDDIPKESFEEVQTGEDFAGQVVKLSHNLLGALVWIGITAWAVYVWGFAGTPVTDLLIALGVWVGTFVFTVFGVPAVRRTARGRAKK
jgi:hypothetical protein